MAASTVLVIAAVGIAVGLLSGLIGIGGGVLIVPFLYFFYDRPDLFGVLVRPEARAVLAHGTSLFVIVPTSIRGALTYHRAGLVDWRAALPIGVTSAFAALAGARLARVLPAGALKVLFGVLLVVSAVRLLRREAAGPAGGPTPEVTERIPIPTVVGIGGAVGVLSSLLGVGGGLVAMPLLVRRVGIRRLAATSIGIITITATAGTLAYLVNGWGEPGLPAWSLGYVDVTAGLAMFLGSVPSVRWGAALNQRMRPRALALLFGAVFMLLGARLIAENLGALAGW